jgi:hypothetical protein
MRALILIGALLCASAQAQTIRVLHVFTPSAKATIEARSYPQLNTMQAVADAQVAKFNTVMSGSGISVGSAVNAAVAATTCCNSTSAVYAYENAMADASINAVRRQYKADVTVLITDLPGDHGDPMKRNGYKSNNCPRGSNEAFASLSIDGLDDMRNYSQVMGGMLCAGGNTNKWVYVVPDSLICKTRFDVMGRNDVATSTTNINTWTVIEGTLTIYGVGAAVSGIGGSPDSANTAMVTNCPAANGTNPPLTYTCASIGSCALSGGVMYCPHERKSWLSGVPTTYSPINSPATSAVWTWTCPLQQVDVFGSTGILADGQPTAPSSPWSGNRVLDNLMRVSRLRNAEFSSIASAIRGLLQ